MSLLLDSFLWGLLDNFLLFFGFIRIFCLLYTAKAETCFGSRFILKIYIDVIKLKHVLNNTKL